MLGYGMLAWSYWRGLRLQNQARLPAWLLVVAYALTDELHQAFVPGRQPSLVDVLFFDGLGGFLGLVISSRYVSSPRDALLASRARR